VAIDAFLKTLHHLRWMRNSVAILTSRPYTMFVLVAKYTLEFGVLSMARLEFLLKITMTGTAILVGNVVTIGHVEWLMDLVARYTILELLSLPVRLMALQTAWNVAMLGVAECTVHLGMGTGIAFYLIHLLGVTSGTCRHVVITAEDNVQRCVGVLVAPQASFKLKVLFTLMAFGAFGDDFFPWYLWRVTSLVTVQTTHFCLVLSTGLLVLMNDLWMTLDAVAVLKLCIRSIVFAPSAASIIKR